MALRYLISILCLLCSAPAQADEAAQLPVLTVESTALGTPSASQLDNSPLRSRELGELLNQAAGVQVRSGGGLGAYAEASLRGSSARQVQILFDGVPLELAGGQAINLALFPAAVVERAEIYRGSTPLGISGGAAGAINLRPADPHRARRRLNSHYGSFASWRVAALNPGAAGLFSLGAEASDNDFAIRNPYKPFDPEDPQRRAREPRRHAATDQQFGLWHQRWALDKREIKALVYGFQQDQQLPDRVNSAAPQTRLDSALLLADLSLLDDEDNQLSVQLQQHQQHYLDPGSRIGLSRQDQRMRSRRAGLRYLHQQEPLSWQLRVSWQDYRNHDALAESTPRLHAERHTLGGDVNWRQGLLHGQLETRLQLDYFDESASLSEPTAQQQWMIQPQLSWQSLSTKACRPLAQLGLREHPAGFVERFGDRGYVRGNPQLRSEQLLALDLGLSCRNALGRLRGQLFAQDLRDAISFVYDARGVGRAQNTQRARIYGLELESEVSLGRSAGLRLAATWLESEDRSSVRGSRGRQLPGRARWQAFARLQLHPDRAARWLLFHEFEFAAEQYYDSSNLLKAPTTRLHHSGVSRRWQRLLISLEARNWLNQTHAQFNGFPRPGRSWQLGLHFDFDQGETS